MKAKLYDRVRTLVDVPGFISKRIVPKGTEGTIVEVFEEPEEYAADVDIPDEKEPTGCAFDNLPLTSEQFEVIRPYLQDQTVQSEYPAQVRGVWSKSS